MERKTKKKLYPAKRYPLYSIQFTQNRGWDNYLKMHETSNIQEAKEPLKDNIHDMSLFGIYIAESKLLSKGDKEAFAWFCESYLSNYKKFL